MFSFLSSFCPAGGTSFPCDTNTTKAFWHPRFPFVVTLQAAAEQKKSGCSFPSGACHMGDFQILQIYDYSEDKFHHRCRNVLSYKKGKLKFSFRISGSFWKITKRTQWEINAALTFQTPQCSQSDHFFSHLDDIIGRWVGDITSGNSSGGKKGGSEEQRKQRNGAAPPLCTLTDPLLGTGEEISRTKAGCHPDRRSFRGKRISADRLNAWGR